MAAQMFREVTNMDFMTGMVNALSSAGGWQQQQQQPPQYLELEVVC